MIHACSYKKQNYNYLISLVILVAQNLVFLQARLSLEGTTACYLWCFQVSVWTELGNWRGKRERLP